MYSFHAAVCLWTFCVYGVLLRSTARINAMNHLHKFNKSCFNAIIFQIIIQFMSNWAKFIILPSYNVFLFSLRNTGIFVIKLHLKMFKAQKQIYDNKSFHKTIFIIIVTRLSHDNTKYLLLYFIRSRASLIMR